MIKVEVDSRQVDAALRKINAAMRGRTPELREMYADLASFGLRTLYDTFQSQGRRFGRWRRPSVVTVLLRRPARGRRKYYTVAEAMRDRRAKALMDTGLLRNSFSPLRRHTGQIRRVSHEGAVVGSRLTDRGHSMGGVVTFHFDEAAKKRLRQNLSPYKPGRRYRRRPDGKRQQWKRRGLESPHNPEFGRMFGAMRKMDGRSFRVPKRPIAIHPYPWTLREIHRIGEIVRTHTNIIMRRATRGL